MILVRDLPLFSVLLCASFGCVSTGASPGGSRELEADEDEEGTDDRLALETTVDADNGLKILITVRIAPDQHAVSFDYEDDTIEATWDGKDDLTCGCRHFVADRFAVTVTFPKGGDGGQALVERR